MTKTKSDNEIMQELALKLNDTIKRFNKTHALSDGMIFGTMEILKSSMTARTILIRVKELYK